MRRLLPMNFAIFKLLRVGGNYLSPLAGLLWLVMVIPCSAQERSAPPPYNRDIRPILSDHCFACHGPDKNHRQAELRLDMRADALAKNAFVPGNADESELWRRITSNDPDVVMPPPDANKPLTPQQRDLLRQWIAAGAEYQEHWAYTPLVRPEVPLLHKPPQEKTGQTSVDEQTNAIDAFIRAPLAARGIAPSPPGEKAALIRRLSLDLLGLPPAPADVAAYVADPSPDAYERLVDRLLASPHFGERMAVWWLDVARFSDTVGFHGDQNQRIFPYRDYVINSFNANKPFDQFTLEQLAGDLLPNPTPEQLIASGFNRLNMMTREGGAQPGEYIAKYQADRVRTVGGAWLGATLGCCECHDHKYDPFQQADFYALSAFFADIKQWGVYADYHYTPEPELRGVNNDWPFPPEILVDSPALAARLAKLERQAALLGLQAMGGDEHEREHDHARESWLAAVQDFVRKHPAGWEVLHPSPQPSPQGEGAKEPSPQPSPQEEGAKESSPNLPLAKNQDGFITITDEMQNKQPQTDLWFSPTPGWVAAIRLELGPETAESESSDDANAASPPPAKGANKSNRKPFERKAVKLQAKLLRATNPIHLDLNTTAADDKTATEPTPPEPKATEPLSLKFSWASANSAQPRYANGADQLGVLDPWNPAASDPRETLFAVWILAEPVQIQAGDTLLVQLSGNVNPVRISVTPLAQPRPLQSGSAALRTAFLTDSPDRTLEQQYLIASCYAYGTPQPEVIAVPLRKLQREIAECRDGRAWTMITQPRQPLEIRLLPRGNWQDASGPVMQPATLHFLPRPTVSDNRRLTRVDLARWICASDNPLTPRTFANRLWKEFFGKGLSAQLDDLGAQGEAPSHPELLDWLAVEFRESGWNVKHLVKLLVMSQTYRQSSRGRPELRDLDPHNRWLTFQNPRRLEAEFIRDNALAISGLLNTELGGPSVRPYQPAGYYAQLQFPDRDYQPHLDERQYRRGVYMHWQRTFLHPQLANFDAPPRDECTAQRVVSNTPQQALTLLNDPTFNEAARALAERVILGGLPEAGPATTAASSPSPATIAVDQARLNRLYQLALARDPSSAEQASLFKFLAAQREEFARGKSDAAKYLGIGLHPQIPRIDPVDLAAWSGVCRVVLNLQETITRY
ncbi:MAG: DUF1553 domain-containing protein [Pirellulales bacterium]|nr:DUF1553 domain-containing protein [Pirellulales bacterium]